MSQRHRDTDGRVVDSLRQMYAQLANPAVFDQYLHPDLTVWEEDRPGPVMDKTALDELRERRRISDGASIPELRLVLTDVVADTWDDVAVVRYHLATTDAPESVSRCTDVLVREGRPGDAPMWRIIHRHASSESTGPIEADGQAEV